MDHGSVGDFEALVAVFTTDLNHRMHQHGAGRLCAEQHVARDTAAKRESEIKGWRRQKKLELIRHKR